VSFRQLSQGVGNSFISKPNINPSIVGIATPTPPSSADSGIGRKTTKKKRKKKAKPMGYVSMRVSEPIPFPRAKPLPAVGESRVMNCQRPAGSR